MDQMSNSIEHKVSFLHYLWLALRRHHYGTTAAVYGRAEVRIPATFDDAQQLVSIPLPPRNSLLGSNQASLYNIANLRLKFQNHKSGFNLGFQNVYSTGHGARLNICSSKNLTYLFCLNNGHLSFFNKWNSKTKEGSKFNPMRQNS